MKFTKILGLILLAVGLALIGWTLYSSYNIFTGKAAAPEIFSAPEEENSLWSEKTTEEQMIEVQMRKVFPVDAEVFPNLFNLVAWSILAFILIFAGGQIAGLGIKLLK
jgi:hypothetical protein